MPDEPAEDFGTASAAMRELGEQVKSGHFIPFEHLPDASVVIHPHDDGSVDTLAMKHEEDVMVQRTDPNGFVVWTRKGVTLEEALHALSELPDPGQPGAPVVAKIRRPLDADM